MQRLEATKSQVAGVRPSNGADAVLDETEVIANLVRGRGDHSHYNVGMSVDVLCDRGHG